jgi:ClpP class serine protease
MAHELLRLREKLVNTPLLADTETFNSVVSYLNERNLGDFQVTPVARDGDEGQSSHRFLYNEDTQTAVMHIEGPLSYKPVSFMGFDCGGANYTNLKEDIETAIDLGAKTIAWMVDSGGGEAHQMTDSAKYIRNLLDEKGVRLLTYVDGRSASAAYGLTAISDEIIASKDSELGSIGVLVQLMNNSEALKMNGYERTFITAGDEKIPFDKDGKFREGFLEDLQNKVDVCYKDFTEHVAVARGMPVEAVRATQAKMFFASDAVELGLADKVMTPEEFYSYLADAAQLNMSGDTMNTPRIFKFFNTEEDPVKLEELQAALTASEAQLATVQADLSAALADKETVVTSLAEMVTENEKLAEALASVEGELAGLKAEQADAKVAARKTALSAVVAADKVDGMMANLAPLDDVSFSAVVAGFASAKATVEQSEMMTELGQDAEEVSTPAKDDQAGNDATLAFIKNLQRR